MKTTSYRQPSMYYPISYIGRLNNCQLIILNLFILSFTSGWWTYELVPLNLWIPRFTPRCLVSHSCSTSRWCTNHLCITSHCKIDILNQFIRYWSYWFFEHSRSLIGWLRNFSNWIFEYKLSLAGAGLHVSVPLRCSEATLAVLPSLCRY